MSSTSILEHKILEYIHKAGWAEPTPIQRKAFPVLLRKRNSLIVAPTGSGKTEAAVIPIFTLLGERGTREKGVRALYITPLRALNRDILRRVISYAEDLGLTVDIRHGDTPASARQKMLASPPDVLITTPETLAILLTSRKMRLNLRKLEWVVADELHELLGSERGVHLTVSLERLQSLCTQEVVRVGLSATVSDLEVAARFLVGTEKGFAVLTDPSLREYDVVVEHVDGPLSDAAERILAHVTEISKSGGSVLLFTNTRDEAEYLGALLKAKSPDTPVDVHHGSLSREFREETEARLREGAAGLVVSTSSLELGLDIGAVDLVIHWGSPRQAVKLVQRIGRSKHRLGETAQGRIVTNRLDEELEAIALVERVRRGSLEASVIHDAALDVMAHHLVGMCLESSLVRIEDAVALFNRAYPFRSVGVKEVDLCLRLLERQGIIRYDGEIMKRRGPKTYTYYYENISTIPDIQQFDVIDTTSKRKVGRLDQVFVGEYGEPGKPFVLKGSSWKIISVDDGKQIVYVEPTFKDLSTIPYWVGELIPVDFETAREVGRLRRHILKKGDIKVSEGQKQRLQKAYSTLGVLPDERTVVAERRMGGSMLVLHACFGTKVNQTLATLLSTIISSKTGYIVEAKSDACRIVLSSYSTVTVEHVRDTLLAELDLKEILSAAVVGTHPLNWKTWYVAKKFGVVMKNARYDRRASRLIQERYRGTALHEEVLRELMIDKYDLARTREVISNINTGRVRLVEKVVEDYSTLAKPILEYASSFAALPLSVEKTILQLVRERLEKAKHKLLCLSCGEWESVVRTMDAKEELYCPLCRSRLVTETYLSDQTLLNLVKGKLKGRRLTAEEEELFKRAWKTSSLIQTFGRKALIVLSGFGVGADTAARILRKSVDEDEMYRNVYRAEKTYVATRGFWDD